MLLTSSKLLKAQMGGGGRQRRGQFAQCLSWNIHLPSTSGSQTLRPWHGFAALASLVLRLLHLDCNCTTGFHEPSACRWQVFIKISKHHIRISGCESPSV